MNLVPEKFKIIPATYNGNDFMKIQYVAVCFSSFSISYDRLNAYAKQVKVNEFLKEEKIESMYGEED